MEFVRDHGRNDAIILQSLLSANPTLSVLSRRFQYYVSSSPRVFIKNHGKPGYLGYI
jgi:hypothetical protein